MNSVFFILALVICQVVARLSFAGEFIIGPYRAYSLMGEPRLLPGTDYVAFAGDFGFSDWTPPPELMKLHLSYEGKLLSNFQLNIINLEAMLPGVSGRQRDIEVDKFVINTLRKAGWHLVGYANNHALDYGPEGVNHNRRQLSDAGLHTIGTRESPVYRWATGDKEIAIFAVADALDIEDMGRLVLTTSESDLEFIKERISQADFRIAFVHLGSMSRFLSPHERRQAGRLLNVGADLVVCTGSHFIKGFVVERDKPVAYGIGNHLFLSVDSSTEAIGMYVIAGFRSGKLLQLFAVPFHNAVHDGKIGPLDPVAFESFKTRFIERSSTDPEKYYSDPHSLKRLKETLGRFRLATLHKVRTRHFIYAGHIVFQNYPLAAVVFVVVIVGIAIFAVWWVVGFKRRRKSYQVPYAL